MDDVLPDRCPLGTGGGSGSIAVPGSSGPNSTPGWPSWPVVMSWHRWHLNP